MSEFLLFVPIGLAGTAFSLPYDWLWHRSEPPWQADSLRGNDPRKPWTLQSACVDYKAVSPRPFSQEKAAYLSHRTVFVLSALGIVLMAMHARLLARRKLMLPQIEGGNEL